MYSKNKPAMTTAERAHVGKVRLGWFERRFEAYDGAIKSDCVCCARAIWLPLSKTGKYKTCGGTCAAAFRRANKDKRSRCCATCGDLFTPRKVQIANGGGLFCSQACNVKAHQAMNAKPAQIKARAGWREANNRSPIAKSGADNVNWNGGIKAAQLRALPKVAEYKRNNRDKVRQWAANRRTRGATKVPANVVQRLVEAQRGNCPVCQKKFGISYHLDHIQPIARGGTNDAGNLQILCRACNLSKAAKDPIQFMQSRGYLL